jgi:tetratricopeptide (TPR) repeat protein
MVARLSLASLASRIDRSLEILFAGRARRRKFTHTSDVGRRQADGSHKPIPKRAAPQAPTATATEILKIQVLIGPILEEQIGLLNDLIKNTPDSERRREGRLLLPARRDPAKQHRFHRLKAVESEIALGRADAKAKPATQAAMAEHKAKAHQALMDAIRTYKLFVDNPVFRNAPRIDTALFYFAYTLQSANYMKEARQAYDKLLKDYPKSKYVAEAHLAFAEYHFELRQLAEAEARYRKVLEFPQASVYRYAQYKLGWVDYNLGKFTEALQVFNDVAQATKRDPDKAVLHRAAKQDFVRAYAEIGKADKALPAFRRVDGGDGIGMLSTLADLYLDQGKSDKAIFVLRQLMTERPTSPNVCFWEHSVARAMLTIGSGDDKIHEIEQLVKLYVSLRDRKTLPKAEAIECRDAASEMSGQLARAYHQEGVKTKNMELLGYAGRLYRAYLGVWDADFGETAVLPRRARGCTRTWSQRAPRDREVEGGGERVHAGRRARQAREARQIAADAVMLAWMKALHVNRCRRSNRLMTRRMRRCRRRDRFRTPNRSCSPRTTCTSST